MRRGTDSFAAASRSWRASRNPAGARAGQGRLGIVHHGGFGQSSAGTCAWFPYFIRFIPALEIAALQVAPYKAEECIESNAADTKSQTDRLSCYDIHARTSLPWP